MDNDHSDHTVTGWALKDRHLVLKLQKLIWRWAPAKTLGKMSPKLISSWKGSKRRSQHSLSLLVIRCISGLVRVPNLYFGSIQYSWGPWLYRDQQNAVKSIWEIQNFAAGTNLLSKSLLSHDFSGSQICQKLISQNCFASKFASYQISRSQMNIDATLLSICSFCNIWYRSLSNFYSATAKHTMYDGVLWWSIHGEVLLQIFTFWFKVFSSDIFVDPTHNDARHSAQAHKGRFLFHQIKWFLRNFLNGPLPRVGKI